MINKGPYWEKNIKACQDKRPLLFKMIKKFIEQRFVDDALRIEMALSATGKPVAKILQPNNSIWLHSPDDPELEAKNIVDTMELCPGELRFLIGFGLGYLPKEVLRRGLPFYKLIIFEKSPEIFYVALNYLDIEELIRADNVAILLGDSVDFTDIVNEHITSLLLTPPKITIYEPIRQLFPEYCLDIQRRVQDVCESVLCEVRTTRNVGKIMFENSMLNFTTAIHSANLAALKDLFKGQPGVVIGAGPSLNTSLPILKEFKNKIVTLAVDSSLPPLVRYGIKPDIVASVDYHPISYEKFRPILDETEDVPLAYVLPCGYMTVKTYKSPIKFFDSIDIPLVHDLRDQWGGLAHTVEMNAVAHLALHVAMIMGLDPIIFVGFDLAYVDFESHAKGMTLPLDIDLENLHWVESVTGQQVPTSVQLIAQREVIERLIKKSDILFVNASKGLKISGTVEASLAKILLKYADCELNAKNKIVKAYYESPKPTYSKLIGYLGQEIKKINVLREHYQEGIKAARQAIFYCNSKNKKRKNTQKKIKQYVSKALRFYEKYGTFPGPLANAIQLIESENIDLFVKEAEFKIKDRDGDSDKLEKVALEMEMIQQSFQTRLNAISRLEDYFQWMFEVFSLEHSLDKKLKEKKGDREKAALFFKIGQLLADKKDLSRAECYLTIASTLDPENPYILSILGKIYGFYRMHTKALKFLKKAYSLDPSNTEIFNLLQEEIKYPERLLKEAKEYIEFQRRDDSGLGKITWALKNINEVLTLYPNDNTAKKMKRQVEDYIFQSKEKKDFFIKLFRMNLNEALEKIRQIGESEIETAQKALMFLKKQHPHNIEILILLSSTLIADNKISEAEKILIQIGSLAPNDPRPDVMLAECFLRLEKWADAARYLSQAIKKDKNLFDLYEQLGLIYKRMARYEDAITAFEKLFIHFPYRKEILREIGDCYMALGLKEAAHIAYSACKKN
ncbi:hypothetical protein DBT_2438 [Dissulfuribacter thermophilus]|uniref:6-hydroxymethylpterin diphosphokinase MptE-like domain-containing protein n=1 Tax=Dissulfuribacter thermophilus TaxID=1156395 RepID=A0A1B9F2Q2_9BACT|nr:6-hydroxymethylpterin diphosphokinase MptE-like protein [Dissulfuribacter thermophilus]OCC14153.1 hypothetical protein DBT_2438 [Dissulfuribacter thermophilus]